MDAVLRTAGRGDAATVLGLMREFYQIEHLRFDAALTPAALVELIENERLGRVWVAEWAGTAVGYLVLTYGYSLEYFGRDALIDELYLREEHRGQGIGRALMEAAATHCRAVGVRALHLEVDFVNTRAKELYRRAGFVDHQRYLMTRWVGGREDDGGG